MEINTNQVVIKKIYPYEDTPKATSINHTKEERIKQYKEYEVAKAVAEKNGIN